MIVRTSVFVLHSNHQFGVGGGPLSMHAKQHWSRVLPAKEKNQLNIKKGCMVSQSSSYKIRHFGV